MNGFPPGIVSRFDDITFVNDSTAYAAQGSHLTYKSTDGGNNWTLNHIGIYYKRSIEFIDEAVGFCGSLDSLLYMTTDSGNSWVDISTNISPRPSGICGLSSPNDSTIYGCGIYSSPAYVVKSTDKGQTWQSINMSAYASALVDIVFLSLDTGFASGISNNLSEGGVILYTTDAGSTWQKVFTTNTLGDYVWKLQLLDSRNYFGSISSTSNVSNSYFTKSTDGGVSWTKRIVANKFFDIQLIGFIDSLHGWTGGAYNIYETVDGGNNWTDITFNIPQASKFNRFYKYNDSVAFFTGKSIYKYTKKHLPTSTIEAHTKKDVEPHEIKLFQNPSKEVSFSINFSNNTRGFIQLIGVDGKVLENIYNGYFSQGIHQYSSSVELSAQVLFISIRTNEGYQYRKVVITD
jgi:photosystem II stability/assembly factor-like uncharacterized protein